MPRFLRRVGPVFQWAAAVAFLGSAVWVGASVVRELRAVTGGGAGRASDTVGPPPSSVPPGVVSVPVLLFDDGQGIRVGDRATHIAQLLGRGAETGRQKVDETPDGERLTRFYEYEGRRFALVFALAESHDDPPVTAIYLE